MFIRNKKRFRKSDNHLTPGALLLMWIKLISASISSHMANKVCDEITYLFLNFNGMDK